MDTQQQLVFQFLNKAEDKNGAPNVIYISDQPAYNLLVLQFTLDQGQVKLNPSQQIVDPSQLPPPQESGTLIYLDLSPLSLSPSVLSKLSFQSSQWKCQLFPKQQIVGMTPITPIDMSSGAASLQSIQINNLQITRPPTTPTVNLVMQVYDPNFQSPYSGFQVALQNAADGKKKNLQDYIVIKLGNESGGSIINSYQALIPVSNSLELVFMQGQKQGQVHAGQDTIFNVSFVYGSSKDKYGFGALMTTDQALNIQLSKGDNTQSWDTHTNQSAEIVSWDLVPPASVPIIGNGLSATASFNFNSLITTYQPGPTIMLVTYKNVPGYKDGVYTILLNKIPHVVVKPLTITPNPTYVQNGKAQVIVSWEAAYQTALTLVQQYERIPLSDKATSKTIDLDTEKTALSLIAEGSFSDLGNRMTVNATAIALPVINSFTGSPTEIYYEEASHQGTFSWAVDTAGSDQITLNSTGSAFSGGSYDPSSTTTALINGPQMITLSPQGSNNAFALTRKLVISAFLPQPSVYHIEGVGKLSNVAASPSDSFIAATDSANNQVIILDTVDYKEITTVSVGQTPGPVYFSADGNLMLVINKGDNSLTPVTITRSAGQPIFSPGIPIKSLGGSPQSLTMSPDGSFLYVVIDKGSHIPGELIAFKIQEGQSYQLYSNAPLGIAPRGMTAAPSGAAFYVANSADNTVSVIGIDHAGHLSLGTVINFVGNQPTDVVLSQDNKLLLVTCYGDNCVAVIESAQPNTGQRGKVPVGKGPVRISIMPSGAYALVCNFLDDSLTLISCGFTVNTIKALGNPIQVGLKPTDVNVTPDGLNVITANSGNSSISNVFLITYQAAGNAVPLGNMMTHAAVAPDKSSVFVWQNPYMNNTTTPGIVAYAVATATQQSFFDTNQVIGLVFSPISAQQTAYALVLNQKQLYTINTQKLTYTQTDLPLSNISKTLALSMSGDGSTLFVVVADTQSNVVLLVLSSSSKNSWTLSQSLKLYQPSGSVGPILIESSLGAMSLMVVDPVAKKAFVVRYKNNQYVLDPTSLTLNGSTVTLTILPNGLTAYLVNSAGTTHTITVVDMATLNSKDTTIQQVYVAPTCIVSSPDSRRLYISDANSAALRILDPQSLRILQTIKLISASGGPVQNPFHVAITNDASSIYVVNNQSNDLSIVNQVSMASKKEKVSFKSLAKAKA